MSIEGIRVVLVHEPDQKPERWISLLTELCAGTEPVLVAAPKTDAAGLAELEPHRIIVTAALDPRIFTTLMESIPMLAAPAALESFLQAFGGRCLEASSEDDNYLMHDGVGIWTGFGEPIEVAGYPLLAPDQSDLPAELVVTAWNDERVALSLSHRLMPLVAWNFQPDDLGPKLGRELLLAFLEGTYLMGTPSGPPEI